MKLFILFISTILITLKGTRSDAQSCNSLFEQTSILSTLATSQVEITYRQDISNTQKQMLLTKIEEEVQQFVSESSLSPRELERFYANYRALVFEAELNLKESLILQSIKTSGKNVVLDKQEQALTKLKIIQNLITKYKAKSLYDVLVQIRKTGVLKQENIDDFKLAIKLGADVNSHEGSWSILHLVTTKNHLELVKILIENHADIEAKTNLKETPLQWAIMKRHTEIAEFLIEMKADANTKDQSGATPLHRAVLMSDLHIAKLLLKHGADVNSKNRADNTLLKMALRNSDTVMADLLKSYGAIE